MDFALSDDERMVLDTVRQFVTRELLPLEPKVVEAEIEGRAFPDPDTLKALQAKARDLGLYALSMPEDYGGAGLSTLLTTLIAMETSRVLVPFKYGGHTPSVLFACTEAQKPKYLAPMIAGEKSFAFALSEPDAGSDATNLKTTATRTATGWMINGQKSWITRGHEADFAVVFAVTDRDKGAKGITAFFVDRGAPGFTSRPIEMMARSDLGDPAPAELFFDNVEVGDDAVLGEVGGGFKAAMGSIGAARVLASARAIGAAQRLLEMALDYAKLRQSFGKPLADYQAIQWMLADSAVELESAKWLTLHAAWRTDQGHDVRFDQSMAKLAGSQTAWQVADRVLQIHGAMGYSKELPVERVMRQLRVYRIYEGADELMKINIARLLLDGKASVSQWD